MFALVDCNNFYVSCERVFRPDLNNQPVAVLSNNDGCIIARSHEVKELGIPMGAPAFEFRNLIQKHRIALFSSNYALYDDMSRRVMHIIAQHFPDVEIYSIDECFIDLSSVEKIKNVFAECLHLRHTIFQWVGIPVSIGIAPTKTLAKAANKYAKKEIKNTSVYIVNSEEKIKQLLQWLPIEDVWGIGSRYASILKNMNVRSADAFTRISDEWIRKHMTIRGLVIKKELLGEKIWSLEASPVRRSVATTRSFEQMPQSFDELRERISAFAANVAHKLRRYKKTARELIVFVRTNPFRQDLPQYHNSILIPMPLPTHSTILITRYACMGLKKIYRKGFLYKKAGVIATGLQDEKIIPHDLFGNSLLLQKHRTLMKTLDHIHSRFGSSAIHTATRDGHLFKRMKQEHISPHYTTRWNDILVVKCYPFMSF